MSKANLLTLLWRGLDALGSLWLRQWLPERRRHAPEKNEIEIVTHLPVFSAFYNGFIRGYS